MNPLAAHRRRQKSGMSIQAEILLDVCMTLGPNLSYSEVKQIADSYHVGSPVTLHNALHWLVDNGYLTERLSIHDGRTKHLNVTRIALRYFDSKEAA